MTAVMSTTSPELWGPDAVPGNMVRCVGVSKTYRDGEEVLRALDNVSLSIAAGEFVALMGPSGSGKSTLLQVCSTILPASTGSVMIDNQQILHHTARQRQAAAALRRHTIGVVYQRLNLIPSLTAEENVALPLDLDGMRRGKARSEAVEALRLVGLAGVESRFTDQLSGGQQQRVAIARAVTGNRKVLLADEPTAPLDTISGDAVIQLLSDLRTERGLAVLLVTHEPRFASWADRVVFIRDGVLDQSSLST